MSAHNTPYHMYQGPLSVTDPGDTNTIVIDRYGSIVLMESSGTETRTLAVPTKAGILATLSLLTLNTAYKATVTVTGGYNYDGDTEIVFQGPGDTVTFISVKHGTNYRWRAIGHEGTSLVQSVARFDELFAAAIKWTGDALSEHGAGAIGTSSFGAPRTYRYTRDETIITEIHVDLTGLGCVGTAAKDVIGLAAGGAAYIGRYVVATYGVVFKIEMICLELPGEGTATITADIDLGAEDVGTSAYDDPCDDIVINTASLVAGEVATTDVPALTANDYLYLIEGDTAATTGVYNAGQYIIRLYGHPVLS